MCNLYIYIYIYIYYIFENMTKDNSSLLSFIKEGGGGSYLIIIIILLLVYQYRISMSQMPEAQGWKPYK